MKTGKDKQFVSLRKKVYELGKRLREMEVKARSLLTQEKIYKDVFDSIGEGIFYASLTGKVISVNHSLEQILEVNREKIIGRTLFALAGELFEPKDLKHIRPLFRNLIAGADIKPIHVVYHGKTLDIRTYRNPKTRMLTGIVHDITESIETINALSKSEARLRRAELASKSGNWELHLKTGKMIGSEGARKLYGVKAEAMDYNELRSVPLPEYRQMMDTALNDLIARNKPYNIEFKIRKVDTDEIIDIHSISEYNRESRVLYGSIQDITERKKIEEKLMKKNRDLSMLFTMSLRLLESFERKDVLMRIVESAANLVGTDTSAIYIAKGEKLFLEATYPALPDNFPEEFRAAKLQNHPHIGAVIETKKTIIINDVSEATLTREEREITEVRNLGSLVYIPLFIQQKVEGVIILGTIARKHHFEQDEIDLFSTFSNITSLVLENSYLFENLRLAMNKAEESNMLKTAFLHNISHEIRTPLNAIIGFSEILCQGNVKGELKREYMSIISQSNNQLLAIIDDILKISHIEARQVVVNETVADLGQILNNLYRQYYPEALKKKIAFSLNTSFSGLDSHVITDENKVIGIITNFLNNAFKFTHDGSVELGGHLVNDLVEFYVSDTGIGIPENEHERIFTRFYQIDKSPSKFYGGLGLGLSISKAYAELLQGRITVESAPGQGSRFALTIPFRSAGSVSPAKSNDHGLDAVDPGPGRSILVAEDENSSFAFIREVLKPLGYNIIRAVNGSDAIDICKSDPNIELILMDMRMPVRDGGEAASEILSFRPQLPIIAQSAYGFTADRQYARDRGCVDYLIKPFSREQLISVVTKHLKQRVPGK